MSHTNRSHVEKVVNIRSCELQYFDCAVCSCDTKVEMEISLFSSIILTNFLHNLSLTAPHFNTIYLFYENATADLAIDIMVSCNAKIKSEWTWLNHNVDQDFNQVNYSKEVMFIIGLHKHLTAYEMIKILNYIDININSRILIVSSPQLSIPAVAHILNFDDRYRFKATILNGYTGASLYAISVYQNNTLINFNSTVEVDEIYFGRTSNMNGGDMLVHKDLEPPLIMKVSLERSGRQSISGSNGYVFPLISYYFNATVWLLTKRAVSSFRMTTEIKMFHEFVQKEYRDYTTISDSYVQIYRNPFLTMLVYDDI